jgi:AraC-like DNA-binding protein
MSGVDRNKDMYFSTNQFELIKSDLTTDDEPIKVGGSVHSSAYDKRFDLHYEMELGIVLTGSLLRTFGNYTETLTSGDVWLHSIWEPHGYQILEAPCETAVIIFRPEMLFELKLFNRTADWFSMFYCGPEHRPRSIPAAKGEIIAIARQLRILPLKDLHLRTCLIQTYLMQILIFLEQSWDQQKSSVHLNPNRFIRIQPALQLAFGSKEFIPEKQAAKLCNLSISVFRREFLEVMNISFPKFSLRYRLRQSSLWLRKSSAPIKEIAYQHGFYDLSHFYRDFRVHFGLTPKEYRDLV